MATSLLSQTEHARHDIDLPGLSGLEACQRILEPLPRAKIAFISRASSTEMVQEAMRMGAHGYRPPDVHR